MRWNDEGMEYTTKVGLRATYSTRIGQGEKFKDELLPLSLDKPKERVYNSGVSSQMRIEFINESSHLRIGDVWNS